MTQRQLKKLYSEIAVAVALVAIVAFIAILQYKNKVKDLKIEDLKRQAYADDVRDSIFLLLLSLTQLMSSVTVYGQLTPQRINYNDTKGIFFTDKQEELLLKSIVDYDYLQKSIARKDEIIKTYELRISDKELEIKKVGGYLDAANERTTECLDRNFVLQSDLVVARDSIETTQGKLHTSRRNNWIFGGHFLGSEVGSILGELKTPQVFKISNQLFGRNYVCHQATIFQAKLLQELGGFDLSYKIAADFDLMARASKLDPGTSIDATIAVFYLGGISSKAKQTANAELLQLRKKHLGRRFVAKNYFFFFYRLFRNYLLLEVEKKSPNLVNIIRKVKFRFR